MRLGRLILEGIWRALGAYRIRRAGPRRLSATAHRIWREPGSPGDLDAVNGPGGPGGAPLPPFRFIEEHTTGSHPCLSVRDAGARRWRVKWGNEVRSETFAVRLAWACGYFAEVTYFVPSGTIAGCTNLARARDCIDDTGAFCDARFELDDPHVRKLFEEHSWAWNDNPFVGTRELTGLKIVVMLLSNWDTKDRRDVARGSNTAIFEHTVGFAEDLGRFLGTAERRANEWLQQRQVLTTQLEQIRDSAARYLVQLGSAPIGVLRRRRGSSASPQTITTPGTRSGTVASSTLSGTRKRKRRKMSAAARKAISEAQKRRWAKQRAKS